MKRLSLITFVILVLSLVLAACAPTAAPAPATEKPAGEAPAVEKPTAEAAAPAEPTSAPEPAGQEAPAGEPVEIILSLNGTEDSTAGWKAAVEEALATPVPPLRSHDPAMSALAKAILGAPLAKLGTSRIQNPN